MRRYVLPLMIYLLFLIQGNLMHKIIPASWQTHVVVAPNLTLIVILFIGIYINSHWSFVYGIAFGMLHDVVYYGPMLGTYSFGMGLTGYLIGLMSQRSPKNLFRSMLLILCGNLLFEMLIYGIYSIFLLVHSSFDFILLHQILPSMLVNLLFALIIYIPIRNLLESIEKDRQKQENEA